MNSSPTCELCGHQENLLRCSRCRGAYYCSKEHQKQHWKKHKKSCSATQKSKDTNNILVGERESEKGTINNIDSNQIKKLLLPSNNSTDPNISSLSINNSKSKLLLQGNNITVKQSSSKRNISPITIEGSSEQEILNAGTEILSPDFRDSLNKSDANYIPQDLVIPSSMPSQDAMQGHRYVIPSSQNETPNINGTINNTSINNVESLIDLMHTPPPFLHTNNRDQKGIIDEICKTVIKDMDAYGVCVVDNFLGPEKGYDVLSEVIGMHDKGEFKDGQLVSNKVTNDLKTIRGDKIKWIHGKENHCTTIGLLISRVDAVIMRANQMSGNGKLGNYTINGRTKVR
jgi:hypoxia-inducible factor (prolyl hydroxylase)